MLSWAHANRIEAQLRQEVQALLALAEKSDRAATPDGMDVPAEIARREDRLDAISQAKAKIEQHALERLKAEQQEFAARQARRRAQRDAGKKPRGKDPEPPEAGPRDGDQVNLTDEESRIMPISGGGFAQSYNAQAGVDTDTMMVITAHVTQACNDQARSGAHARTDCGIAQGVGRGTHAHCRQRLLQPRERGRLRAGGGRAAAGDQAGVAPRTTD